MYVIVFAHVYTKLTEAVYIVLCTHGYVVLADTLDVHALQLSEAVNVWIGTRIVYTVYIYIYSTIYVDVCICIHRACSCSRRACAPVQLSGERMNFY